TPWREAPWDESEAVESAPAAITWTALPGTVQHGFTHFRLELALMAGRTAAPPEGIWARPAAFKDYAFPTLTKKLVNYALSAGAEPWGGRAQRIPPLSVCYVGGMRFAFPPYRSPAYFFRLRF